MRPGNCSGSYSEPPRARAIALRSSSRPREVDATTFSIRNLAMGVPPRQALHAVAVYRYRTQLVPYMLRCARDPRQTGTDMGERSWPRVRRTLESPPKTAYRFLRMAPPWTQTSRGNARLTRSRQS